MGYIKDKDYPIKTILSKYKPVGKDGNQRIELFDGQLSKFSSDRYYAFKKFGTKCECCGLEGTHFTREKFDNIKTNRWHFNLYSDNDVMIIKKKIGDKQYKILCEDCHEKVISGDIKL